MSAAEVEVPPPGPPVGDRAAHVALANAWSVQVPRDPATGAPLVSCPAWMAANGGPALPDLGPVPSWVNMLRADAGLPALTHWNN